MRFQVGWFFTQYFELLHSDEILISSHFAILSPKGNSRHSKDKAIAAGVVGGILFFIAAIVLSVCTVKICNERKRRKAEKGEYH